MMLYAYVLWFAALHSLACGPDGDAMHRLLLGMLPFTIGAVFALRITHPLPEVHSILRWLGVPLLLLMPFCLRSLWDVIAVVHLESVGLCTEVPPPVWQQFWSLLQLATLLLLGYRLLMAWRDAKNDGS